MEITEDKILFLGFAYIMKYILVFFLFSFYMFNAMSSEVSVHSNEYEKSVRRNIEGLACVDMQGIPYLLLNDGTMYGVDAWPQNILGHYVHVVVEEEGVASRKLVEAKIMHSSRSHKEIPFKTYGIIRYDPEKHKGGYPCLEMELDNGKTILIELSGNAEQLNANRNTRKQIIGSLHILPLLDKMESQPEIIQNKHRRIGNVVYVLVANEAL